MLTVFKGGQGIVQAGHRVQNLRTAQGLFTSKYQQENKEKTAEKSLKCCYLLHSKENQQTLVGADLYLSIVRIPPYRVLFLALHSAGRSTLCAQPSREETRSMATDAKVRQAEAAV